MSYDKDYILQHVKDFKTTQFTVYITEPITMQRIVAPLPYCQSQVTIVAKKKNENWELTEHGLWLANNALEALNDKAEFVFANQSAFKSFFDSYNKEFDAINNHIKRLRDERRKTDYRESTDLFNKIVKLTKQRDTLYYDMYRAQFGDDAFYLSKLEVEQLIKL